VTPKTIAAKAGALMRSAKWALALSWDTHPGLTAGIGGATLIHGVVPALLAWVTKGLIDAIVVQVDAEPWALAPIMPWLVAGVVLAVLEAVSQLARTYMLRRIQDDLNLRITTDVLEHAARLDVAYFEDPRAQDVLERAKGNSAMHFARFLTQSLDAVSAAVQVVSLSAVLITIEPLVMVVIVPFAVPYLIHQWRLARKHYRLQHSRATKRRWTSYFTSCLTSRRFVPEVKILELGPLLIQKFRTLMTEFRDQDKNVYIQGLKGSFLFMVLTTLAVYGLLVRVIVRALNGTATLGDIAVFVSATMRLRVSVEKGVSALTGAYEGTLFISNLMAFLEEEPRLRSRAGRRLPSCRGEVAFEDVHFTYPGSGEPVIRGLSFDIQPGETLAFVGENGSGKTTLVKLLARMYDPDRGIVRLDGYDVRDLDLVGLRSKIAFVFQQFGRYEASAAENIAYGDWRRVLDDEEAVRRVARLAGVDDFVRNLPDGYHTMLGRAFGQYDLSGGQWQKVAVARAFTREAAILILDEPTSNLDARAEAGLFYRFRELAHGRTTILVSHRFSTVSMADRIIVLDRGRIVEQGTHEELLRRDGHYASLYDLHMSRLASPIGG